MPEEQINNLSQNLGDKHLLTLWNDLNAKAEAETLTTSDSVGAENTVIINLDERASVVEMQDLMVIPGSIEIENIFDKLLSVCNNLSMSSSDLTVTTYASSASPELPSVNDNISPLNIESDTNKTSNLSDCTPSPLVTSTQPILTGSLTEKPTILQETTSIVNLMSKNALTLSETPLEINKPLETIKANTEKPASQPLTEPSTSYKHVYWGGKIQYKKRKAPKEKLPSMISSKQYRSLVIKKAKSGKSKKLKNTEWTCIYCDISWSEDKKGVIEIMWVACDKCPLAMHFNCIPQAHKKVLGLKESNIKESDFMCEACFNESKDSS